MSQSGLVSVVVPFLNAERFLGDAIESVQAQTYGKWELLLVDDGATDGSAEIARDYAARDPQRVTSLAHPSRATHGPAMTRNLGLASAKGEFVAFLDADDVWMPEKLEQQVRLLSARSRVGMVYGSSQWWYSWDGPIEGGECDFVQPLGLPTGVVEPPTLIRPFFVSQSAAIPNPSNLLVRRWVIEQAGGFEESVPHGHEDQAFCAKVVLHVPVLVWDACWDRYRQHPQSLTAKQTRQREEAAARRRFLDWLIAYVSGHGIEEDTCRALRRQRFRYAHPRLARFGARARRAF